MQGVNHYIEYFNTGSRNFLVNKKLNQQFFNFFVIFSLRVGQRAGRYSKINYSLTNLQLGTEPMQAVFWIVQLYNSIPKITKIDSDTRQEGLAADIKSFYLTVCRKNHKNRFKYKEHT